MSLFDRALNWLFKWSARKLRARMSSRGERAFAASYPGGRFGFWSADRTEQCRHYKSWVYAGIQARAKEMSRHEPHLDYVDEMPATDRIARVNAHTLHARVKGITKPRPHEELRPAENNHPLVELFRTPNPYDTLADLYFEHALFKCLTGNSYWWAPRNLAGLPCELWILPSHWVFPVGGKDRLVDGYWFNPYGAGGSAGGGVLLPPEEVLHFRDKNPLHKIDGYSPLTAGAEIIDVSEAVNTSRWSHFERGMQPGLHIELGEGTDLDDEEMDRYYAKLLNRFQGRDKHGLPIVTQHGGKVSKISFSPEEMGYFDSAEQLTSFVLAMLQVPKELTGLQPIGSDLSWYAPLRFFTRFVISPELRALDAGHTKHLGELYDPPVRVWHDDPTPDDPKQVNEDVNTDFRTGSRTPNEIRSLRGLEPYDGWGDRPLVPTGLTPAQFEGDPAPVQTMGGAAGGNGRVAPGAGVPGPNGRSPRVAGSLTPAAVAKRLKGEFHEEDHPRDHGQFSEKPGASGSDDKDDSDEEPSHDDPYAAWEARVDARQEAREQAQAAMEAATDPALEESQSRFEAACEAATSGSARVEAAEQFLADWNRHWDTLDAQLSVTGAGHELAAFRSTRSKADAAVGRKASAHRDQAEKLDALTAEQEAHQAREPSEPQEPQEPDYPDEPDPEPFGEDVDAYDRAVEEHTALVERLSLEHDKAVEAWEKEHERWEREAERWDARGERLEERREAAAEKLDERLDQLLEAVEEHYNEKLFEAASSAVEDFLARLDALDEADPEPDHEEDESPLQKHTRNGKPSHAEKEGAG